MPEPYITWIRKIPEPEDDMSTTPGSTGIMPGPAPCPDCGQADQVTYGQNAKGTWIGCIRCQNAWDGFENVPAAMAAWAEATP